MDRFEAAAFGIDGFLVHDTFASLLKVIIKNRYRQLPQESQHESCILYSSKHKIIAKMNTLLDKAAEL